MTKIKFLMLVKYDEQNNYHLVAVGGKNFNEVANAFETAVSNKDIEIDHFDEKNASMNLTTILNLLNQKVALNNKSQVV